MASRNEEHGFQFKELPILFYDLFAHLKHLL